MEKIRRIVILPRELYEQIRTIAQRDHRSLSGPMAHWLAQTLLVTRKTLRRKPKTLTTADKSAWLARA